jgi:hypothetical protein
MKMKTVMIAGAALSIAQVASAGAVYTDATGDIFNASNGNIDLKSVTITNDATNLYISIETNGDLDAANWGKYALGIDTGSGPSVDGNAWGRNISWGRGITHWVTTWADQDGSGINGQVWSFDGTNWNLDAGVAGDDSQHAAGFQIFSVALADLGLSVGDSFEFDLITTANGANDSAPDHLSRSDQATSDWSVTSVAGDFLTYTVTAPIPLPAGGALAGVVLAGGLGVRRRR